MKLQIGDLVPLHLKLRDGATGLFPRALVRDAAGTLIATKDLAHVANGLYKNDTLTMPNTAYLDVSYIVYTDAGHTTLAPYEQDLEVYLLDHKYLAIVGNGATTTVIPCDLGAVTANFWKDALVRYVTGANKGPPKPIGSYSPGVITLKSGYAFPGAGAPGDIIEIITR